MIINSVLLGSLLETVTIGSGALDAGYFMDEECTVAATLERIFEANQEHRSLTLYHLLINPVSWADGTDEQIAQMVAMADNGHLNLADYWSVGDTRTVSLSAMAASGVGESHAAQSVNLVLMNAGGRELVTPTASGRTECSFVVGLGGILAEAGYINSSATNTGGWDSCARRAWCNNVFAASLPDALKPIFKQSYTVTANGSGSTTATSADMWLLPAEKEIFGSNDVASSTAEAALSQFRWNTGAASEEAFKNSSLWTRSPASGSTTKFVYVQKLRATSATASTAYGIAPISCI